MKTFKAILAVCFLINGLLVFGQKPINIPKPPVAIPNPPCKPALITGKKAVEAFVTEKYQHNFDTCNLKQVEWIVRGAISCDGVPVNPWDTVISTNVEVEIVWGNYSKTGHLRARPVDECGFKKMCGNAPAVINVKIGLCKDPAISGSTLVCPGQAATYTFNYTLCTDHTWVIVGAQTVNGSSVNVNGTAAFTGNSNSINVVWSTEICPFPPCIFPNQVQGFIGVEGLNCGFLGLCGTKNTAIDVEIKKRYPLISVLSGPSSISCFNQTVTYSLAPKNGVSYNWSVPSGWSIISGQGTNSITANTNGFGGGQVIADVTFGCGTISPQTQIKGVSVNPATIIAPAAIINTAPNCAIGSNNFSINPVAGINNYTWTITSPSGNAAIVGSPTTTATTISVNFNGESSATVSVRANFNCGSSTFTSLTVNTIALPAQPGAITLVGSTCPGQSITVSIDAVAGADDYTWTVNSPHNIQGFAPGVPFTTTSPNAVIEIVTDPFATITVTPNNVCGSSTTSSITAPVSVAPNTPVIDFPDQFCEGQLHTFSIQNPQAGVEYNWFISNITPPSTTPPDITGNLTQIFNVQFFDPFPTSFDIEVLAIGCPLSGFSLSGVFTINTAPPQDCPLQRIGGSSGDSYHGSPKDYPELLYNLEDEIRLFPNPAKDKLNLILPSGGNLSFIKFVDLQGRMIDEFSTYENLAVLDVSQLSSGLYLLYITHGKTAIRKKVQIIHE